MANLKAFVEVEVFTAEGALQFLVKLGECEQVATAAQGGDPEALHRLPELTKELLALARELYSPTVKLREEKL
jgi:hypothetical protein